MAAPVVRSSAASTAGRKRRGPQRCWALLLCVCWATAPAARSFVSPTLLRREQALQGRGPLSQAVAGPGGLAARQRATATRAVAESVGAKVVAAMSAGAVAAVVQALLSSVTEPIVNRVLVKRMSVKEAMSQMTPALIASFFTTTISTNLIKFPLFEAVAMFISLLPDMSNTVKGLVIGFIFTTATLPITNFRYRMSIQTPVAEAIKPGVLYQAYLPTVVRDMVYAIARATLTSAILLRFTGASASSPLVLFAVVLGGCLISAPFNELRGYLLQSAGKKLTFGEFFKPINFVRSTSLGALNQAIALATGYYLTPVVGDLLGGISAALDAGSWKAFIAVVALLDVIIFLMSKSVSKDGIMSDRFMKQLAKMEEASDSKNKQIEKNQQELQRLQEETASMLANKELLDEIQELKEEVRALPDKLKAAGASAAAA